MNTIYFDMDGTLADFYNVKNWLEDLENESVRPYLQAKPLVKEEVLLSLKAAGYTLGIVSWCSKNGSSKFNHEVKKAKKEWLKKNFPNVTFSECHIIKYGTPKHQVVKNNRGILIDDDIKVRREWKGKAFHPDEFF